MTKVISVAVDQGVNLKKLKRLQQKGLIKLFQIHNLEQLFEQVEPQGGVFTLDVSSLDGPDMLAGGNLDSTKSLFNKKSETDFMHIYGAYLNGNEYFITDNPRDFINDGRREELEAELGLKVRRTEEFLKEIEN